MDFEGEFSGWTLRMDFEDKNLKMDFEDRWLERGSCGRPPEIAAAFFTSASSFDQL